MVEFGLYCAWKHRCHKLRFSETEGVGIEPYRGHSPVPIAVLKTADVPNDGTPSWMSRLPQADSALQKARIRLGCVFFAKQ
jgi:hypothetical protein